MIITKKMNTMYCDLSWCRFFRCIYKPSVVYTLSFVRVGRECCVFLSLQVSKNKYIITLPKRERKPYIETDFFFCWLTKSITRILCLFLHWYYYYYYVYFTYNHSPLLFFSRNLHITITLYIYKSIILRIYINLYYYYIYIPRPVLDNGLPSMLVSFLFITCQSGCCLLQKYLS